MSAVKFEIRRGAYADSIVLMQLQSELKRLAGVLDAGVVMATAANLDLLRAGELLPTGVEDAGAEDMVVVVRAQTEAMASEALAQLDRLLRRKTDSSTDDFRPRSLAAAARLLPEAKWVLISTPGRYAAAIAKQALQLERNVFLYSDNVSLEAEVDLKRQAASDGLLVLGPDCGSAIVNGVGFGFANRVRRGTVGLVCASGTGLQAIACRVHELGAGVSHALGTGGRDLQAEVEGTTARQALDLLARDPKTEVVVLASKSPAPSPGARLLDAALGVHKPVVVYFSGQAAPAPSIANLCFARSLTEAAALAVELAKAVASEETGGDRPAKESFQRPARKGWIRGLFAGGTLALEAAQALAPFVTALHSNLTARDTEPLPEPSRSKGHTVLDLGADEFTVGRLHPMMDQQLRLQRLRQEAADPEVTAILLDVVLGSGAHPDPAGELAPAIADCAQRQDLEIVVVLVGTEDDPQDLESTIERLTASGAAVHRSVPQAVTHVVRRCIPAPPPLASPASLELLHRPVAAINVGLEAFFDDLIRQQAAAIHVDWQPPAGGNEKLMSILEKMKT